jgi:hypothetical protein
MQQYFKRSLIIRSQNPFRFEWEVKNSDPYIQNMRAKSETMSSMVAPGNQESWIDCVLTSQSISKVLYLTKANLDILDKKKVKLL